jgi:hypothetical protein
VCNQPMPGDKRFHREVTDWFESSFTDDMLEELRVAINASLEETTYKARANRLTRARFKFTKNRTFTIGVDVHCAAAADPAVEKHCLELLVMKTAESKNPHWREIHLVAVGTLGKAEYDRQKRQAEELARGFPSLQVRHFSRRKGVRKNIADIDEARVDRGVGGIASIDYVGGEDAVPFEQHVLTEWTKVGDVAAQLIGLGFGSESAGGGTSGRE